jgi:hypothetical protein
MRTIPLFGLLAFALSLAGPALAQTASTTTTTTQPALRGAYPKPIDHGPFTPQASAAYQGGGVVLQGAPGAPPPQPEPTPPGQMPRNAVPQ